MFANTQDFNDLNCTFDELDSHISVQEVIDAVKCLKRDKAAGSDAILNEYLVESIDILSSHISDIFNAILDSGYFPDKWTEGTIIPLYKRAIQQW